MECVLVYERDFFARLAGENSTHWQRRVFSSVKPNGKEWESKRYSSSEPRQVRRGYKRGQNRCFTVEGDRLCRTYLASKFCIQYNSWNRHRKRRAISPGCTSGIMNTDFHYPILLLSLLLMGGTSLQCVVTSDSQGNPSEYSCNDISDCSSELRSTQDAEARFEEIVEVHNGPEEDSETTGNPETSCEEGQTNWAPGASLFEEGTEKWGLLSVEGEYLSVLDFDGDGWPDLLARSGGGAEDFSNGGIRHKHLLRNRQDGTFTDVTQTSGLFASRVNPSPDYGAAAKVVAAGDVNNDGLVDVFVGRARMDPWTGGTDTSEMMLNNGDGTFRLGPEESDARFSGKPSNPASAVFLDANGDGWLDLWLVHNEQSGPTGMQDTLLIGDGTGAFEEVTAQAGLGTLSWASVETLNSGSANSWGWGGTACDLDGDNRPELLAASYGRMLNHLWRDTSVPGTFPQYANEGIPSGYGSDHRIDWTTNLSAQCYCADVPDAEDCDTCPAPADPAWCEWLAQAFGPNYRWDHSTGREPFSLGGVTGTTVCEDLNNDGLLDLVNFEIVHGDVGSSSDPTEVLLNTGESPIRLERPGPETSGLYRVEETPFWDHGDMTGAVFDVDNDGLKDVYIGGAEYAGNRGWLFRQNADLTFEEVSVEDSFLRWRAHGVAVADFDRDGDVDIVVGHSHFRCEGFWETECDETRQVRLYENTFGSQNNWIQVRPFSGSSGAAKTRNFKVACNETQEPITLKLRVPGL